MNENDNRRENVLTNRVIYFFNIKYKIQMIKTQ